ncbi:hypothetical protein R69619_07174 [Paraburkholderia nemoris]|nr:hypothetical protein R69619_07174 [Paraburkholderia nemoris]
MPFEAVDGQYLTTVHYDALTKTTTLMFDLGAQLRLWPNEDVDDHEPQWSLCSIDKAYSSFILSGDIDIAAGDDV